MRRFRNGFLPIPLLLLLSGVLWAQVQQVAAAPELERYRPGVMPDRIVLSWTDAPARSQAVTWRTDTSVAGAVAQIAVANPGPKFEGQAQTVPAVISTLATDLWQAHYHSVTFKGLKPDTLYAYRVGDGAHWSEWFQFRTASDQVRPFSFLYFGDVQNGIRPLWSRVLREAFRAAPTARFLAFGGDLVNDGTSDAQWGELFGAGGWLYGMIPVLPTPGNHEYKKDDTGRWTLTRHWRAHFALPENGPQGLEEYAYYVDYQGARIVSLNSMEMIAEQTAWLDKVLSDNPNRWTIVLFHYPIFSLAKGRDNPDLRAAWKPVFDRHRVDLVLTGHDHTYGRSGLEGATVYATSVSGSKMYELDRKAWMRRAAEDTQLFQVITITGDKLFYEARTATGELYDAFELRKQAAGGNALIEETPSGVRERLR